MYCSEIADSHRNCGMVQDSYTMRCTPQVHGIVHDTLNFVHGVLAVEMNSATDNPMVFAEGHGGAIPLCSSHSYSGIYTYSSMILSEICAWLH